MSIGLVDGCFNGNVNGLSNGSNLVGNANGLFSSDVLNKDTMDTFISTWNTSLTSTGSSPVKQVKLPLVSTGSYNFIVDWGDTSRNNRITSYNQAQVTHTYPVDGDYTISIKGKIQGWAFNSSGDRNKIKNIKRWGCLSLNNYIGGSITNNFDGCLNLELKNVEDVLKLENTTSLVSLFGNATDAIGGAILTSVNRINEWDTSKVTTMSSMFAYADVFNQPLYFNTSKVTSMSFMFSNATNFNQDINNWDVSKVTDMNTMFYNATNFDQPLSGWNTSACTNMNNMFYNATNFNQDINNWDVSKVNNMAAMFSNVTNFNQPIGNWDVSKVIAINDMFSGVVAFNQNIGNWNLSSCTNFTNFMVTKTTLTFSASNLDAIYNGWIKYPLRTAQSTTFGTAKHTSASIEGKRLLTGTSVTFAVSNAVNNGGGLIRLTTATHGRTTNNKVFITGVTGTVEANGLWPVTVISTTQVDLQGSTFTNAYISGGQMRTGYGWTILDGGI